MQNPQNENKIEECENCKGHADGDYGQCAKCHRMITRFPAEKVEENKINLPTDKWVEKECNCGYEEGHGVNCPLYIKKDWRDYPETDIRVEEPISNQEEESISLLIAQSAPFSLIGLWDDADFEHLKKGIKLLISQKQSEAREEERKRIIKKIKNKKINEGLESSQYGAVLKDRGDIIKSITNE